jgi:transcriptional regulator
MYIPKHFLETDRDALAELIEANSFGTLITVADGRPFASHVPFLYERAGNTLHAHVARANPQWRDLGATREVLAIFQGPHGYVSPTWYVDPGVPTWNYAAVHVYGTAVTLDDAAATARHVEALAARFERGNPKPWVPSYDPKRLAGIVGIEIRVTEIQGKLKLSQNRSAADRAGVVAHLAASGTDNDAALARMMEAAGRSDQAPSA